MTSSAQPALAISDNRRLERFDLLTIGIIAALLITIGGVVIGGDRAGVGATLGLASGQTATDSASIVLTITASDPVHLTFTEPMNRASVHVTLQPAQPYSIAWASAVEAIVTAKPAFLPGQRYIAKLDSGAQAINGRPVHGSPMWAFTVEPLRAVYLAPAQPVPGNHDPVNLWMVAPLLAADGQMTPPVQLTHSPYGVVDFAVSPDGRQIAFSQIGKGQTSDLYLLDLASSAIRPLTRCVNAPCDAPAWSPDGSRIVYERADSVRQDSPIRSWLLDVKTLQTAQVFSDSKWLGKDPRWSSDGHTLSVYDASQHAVDLIDLSSGQHSYLPTAEDTSGQFAPGGRPQLALLDLSTTPYGVIRHISIADYQAHTLTSLAPTDGTLADDQAASWSPDGTRLAVMRSILGSASVGAQIYLMDIKTGTATPLVVDNQYAHGALSWSPDGGKLIFQRYPIEAQNGKTGIWTYDLFTRHLTQIAANGYYPQWLP